MNTMIGIFGNPRSAQRALSMLRDRGLRLGALSVIARSLSGEVSVRRVGTMSNRRGAVIGALSGGVLGMIAAILLGIGPLMAGGAFAIIASTLVGAIAGAVVGWFAAALIHVGGMLQPEAQTYTRLLQANTILVAVQVRSEDARHIQQTLRKAGAESVHGAEASAAPPFPTAEDARTAGLPESGRAS